MSHVTAVFRALVLDGRETLLHKVNDLAVTVKELAIIEKQTGSGLAAQLDDHTTKLAIIERQSETYDKQVCSIDFF
jgi:hypothetical protein